MRFAFDFGGYKKVGWCWVIIGNYYVSIEDSTKFKFYDLYPMLKQTGLKIFKWNINIRKYS